MSTCCSIALMSWPRKQRPRRSLGRCFGPLTITSMRSKSGYGCGLRDDSLHLRIAIEGEQRIGLGPNHPFVRDPQSWHNSPLIQEMLFTKAPVVCEDVARDARLAPDHRDYLTNQGCKRFLVIPMFVLGE